MKSAFNNTSILKSANIKIDGVDLGTEDAIHLEIYWDSTKYSVSGNLIVKDNTDLCNLLKFNNNTLIEIYNVDSYDFAYFKRFRVIKFDEVKELDKFKSYSIDFIDELTFAMKNTFISKSFKNFSIIDVFKDFFKNYYTNVLYKEIISYAEMDAKEYIVVPQDRSFFDFIKQELDYSGYTMYQTRTEIVFKKKLDMLSDNLEKSDVIFSELYYLNEHPFKIHDYNIVFNNTLNLVQNAPIEEGFAFDVMTKSVIRKTTEINNDLMLNWSDIDYIKTIGKKYSTHVELNMNNFNDNFNNEIMNNTILEIVVSGNLNKNLLLKNYEVVFSGSILHNQGQLEGDIRMSGLYTAIKITDKIISGKLVQKITLVRADFNEKA